jgi:hypothetical protein
MAAKSAFLKMVIPSAKGGWIYFPSPCLLLCSFLAVPTSLRAAEWYIEPSLRGNVGYDSNPFLTSTNPKSALRYTISPEFLFGVRTPSLDTRGIARVDVIRSTEERLDQTNIFSRLLSTYQDARNTWDIDANLLRYTTFTTTIFSAAIPGVTPTPNQVFNPVIGLTPVKTGATQIGFTPTFSREMTWRTNLELGYRFSTFLFDETNAGLVNSHTNQVRGGVGYKLTPIDTIYARMEYNRFDSDVTQTDWISLLGDIRHSFSRTLTGDFNAGASYYSAKGRIFPTFFATLQRRLPTGSFTTILQRNIYGGAFGTPVGIEQINVLWNIEIVPERWLFSLAGLALHSENIGVGGNPANNRTYFQIEPRLSWQLTRQLFLDLSYRYRRSDRESLGTADSNAVLFGLVYNFDKLSISR